MLIDLLFQLEHFSSHLDAFYSAEVVSKLRQKEQTQSFINKPCSLFVTDRTLIIFDRGTQVEKKTKNSLMVFEIDFFRLLQNQFHWNMSIQHVYMLMYLINLMIYLCIVYMIDN